MATTDWVQVISKMTALTKTGEVSWKLIPDCDLDMKSKRNLQAFETQFLDNSFLLRQFEQFQRKDLNQYFGASEDHWSQKTELIIYSDSASWSVPYSSAINDLFRAVTYKESGAPGFLSQFTKKFPESGG
jgi:hypothetical protein